MPGYKGHLAGGVVTFGAILYAMRMLDISYDQAQITSWCISCLAGCLFPDIDVKSKGQNVFYTIMLFLLLALLWCGYQRMFIALSIASVIPMIVRHRGIFHKLWFIVSAPLLAAFSVAALYPCYNSMIISNALFFIAGAISHLWLDVGLRRMLRF